MIAGILAASVGLPVSAQTAQSKKFVITIDAGHGGHDTGAPGKKSVEKNIALAIALKLGHYIESLMDDVDVFYTRKTDVFITLKERAQIANRNKSDLFISIHVNAVEKKTAPNGTSTYVMGFSKSAENLDLVMQENKVILLEKDYQTTYAGFDPTAPESYIIFNNVQNNNLSQSLELATMVQDQLRTKGNRKDMGVHQGNLWVLWSCAKPSVLIETGFISNPQEEEFLMTSDGQDIIASCIYTAIREYKESIDTRMGTIVKNQGAKADEGPVKKVEVLSLPKEDENKTAVEDKKSKDEVRKTLEEVKKTGDEFKKVAAPVDSLPGKVVESGIEYRIQILASVKKLPANAKDFKGVKDLKEYHIDGYYKYLSKPVKTYQEALQLRRELGASFKGAFIIAFKDGERVPLNSTTDSKLK